MKKSEHTLSWAAITRVGIATGIIYLFYLLGDTLLLILVSAMLASALYPFVKKLNKYLPLSLSAVLVVLILVTPLILIFILIAPGLIDQYPNILKAINNIIDNSANIPAPLRGIDISQYSKSIGTYLLSSTSRITGIITTFITVVFMVIYFLIDFERLKNLALTVIPRDQEERLENLLLDLSKINGQYIRGNIFISIVCGFCIFFGLTILKVPYAAPLALFAAILDLLPLIGAFVGAVPAVILGFSISPAVGILVLILFLIYQQFENSVVAPNVYDKALDMSPALSFIAVIIGTALLGITGAFIALPLAAGLPTLLRYVKTYRM